MMTTKRSEKKEKCNLNYELEYFLRQYTDTHDSGGGSTLTWCRGFSVSVKSFVSIIRPPREGSLPITSEKWALYLKRAPCLNYASSLFPIPPEGFYTAWNKSSRTYAHLYPLRSVFIPWPLVIIPQSSYNRKSEREVNREEFNLCIHTKRTFILQSTQYLGDR